MTIRAVYQIISKMAKQDLGTRDASLIVERGGVGSHMRRRAEEEGAWGRAGVSGRVWFAPVVVPACLRKCVWLT